jgi:hypothetical protein
METLAPIGQLEEEPQSEAQTLWAVCKALGRTEARYAIWAAPQPMSASMLALVLVGLWIPSVEVELVGKPSEESV